MSTQFHIGNNNKQVSNDNTTSQIQIGSIIPWIVGTVVAIIILVASATCARGDLSKGGYESPISCNQVNCKAAYIMFMKANNPFLTNTEIEEILSAINKNAPKYFGTGIGLEVAKEMTLAIIAVESSFMPDPGDAGLAHKYMQIHNSAAKETIKYHKLTGKYDLNNTDHNIDLGMAYIRLLLDTYNDRWKLAILAYNKGPRSVNKLIASKKINSYGGYWDKVWDKKYSIHWKKGAVYRGKKMSRF